MEQQGRSRRTRAWGISTVLAAVVIAVVIAVAIHSSDDGQEHAPALKATDEGARQNQDPQDDPDLRQRRPVELDRRTERAGEVDTAGSLPPHSFNQDWAALELALPSDLDQLARFMERAGLPYSDTDSAVSSMLLEFFRSWDARMGGASVAISEATHLAVDRKIRAGVDSARIGSDEAITIESVIAGGQVRAATAWVGAEVTPDGQPGVFAAYVRAGEDPALEDAVLDARMLFDQMYSELVELVLTSE